MSDKRRRPLAEISEKTDVNFVVQNLYVNSNPRFPSKGGKTDTNRITGSRENGNTKTDFEFPHF